MTIDTHAYGTVSAELYVIKMLRLKGERSEREGGRKGDVGLSEGARWRRRGRGAW